MKYMQTDKQSYTPIQKNKYTHIHVYIQLPINPMYISSYDLHNCKYLHIQPLKEITKYTSLQNTY